MSLITLLADPEATLEVAVEMDSAKRSDGTERTWYFSVFPRATGAAETPANTQFLPYLLRGKVGPLTQSMTGDTLFAGLAEADPGSVVLIQRVVDTDRLSEIHDYTFAGRQVRVKIGRRTDDYGDFETFRTITCAMEPEIVLNGGGLQATFRLASALGRLLNEPLQVRRYAGIPHCLRSLTTTGTVTAARIAAYDLSRFTVTARFRTVAGAPSAGNQRIISKASNLTTSCNWALRVLQTSGFINFRTTSGGATDVDITTASSYADNAFHVAVFAQDAEASAYAMLDDALIDTVTPTGTPDLSVADILMMNTVGDDIEVCDVRIYERFIPPDEARALTAAAGIVDDIGLAALWLFDDNGGGTITDYSTNANNATAAGVLNTDYSWHPTDLGEPELAGRPMPVVVGEVLTAPAHLIDASRERYRLNDGPLGDYLTGGTLVMRSRGTVLTGGGTDYTAPAGTADSVVPMVAAEDEPVTFDLTNSTNAFLTFPPYVAYNTLVDRTSIEAGDISDRYVEILPLCPWQSGFWTESDATAVSALHETLAGSGLCYFENAAGNLDIDVLLPPSGYGPYGDPCYDFRGNSGAKVTFGTAGNAEGSLTVAGWLKTPMLDGSVTATVGAIQIAGRASVAGQYELSFTPSGALNTYLSFTAAGVSLFSSANPIEANVWTFVAGVFDITANTQTIYAGKQGGALVEVVSASNTGTPGVGPAAFTIGSTSASGAWGALQHVQAWSVAKSLAQLEALMATPPVGNEANLVAYCPLTEGEGAPLEVVTSTTGTVTGSPKWAPQIVVNLADTPSVNLTEYRPVSPAGEVVVYYARNRRPLGDADIDSGVSQSDRINLRREWQDVRLYSADNRERYASARKIVVQSPITGRASAQRFARMLMARFGTGRAVGTLELPPGLALSRRALGLTLGDEIGLTAAVPSQLATPRSFRVVGLAPDPLKLSTRLTLWG